MKTYFIETADEMGYIVVAPNTDYARDYVAQQNHTPIKELRELTEPQIWALGKMEG